MDTFYSNAIVSRRPRSLHAVSDMGHSYDHLWHVGEQTAGLWYYGEWTAVRLARDWTRACMFEQEHGWTPMVNPIRTRSAR